MAIQSIASTGFGTRTEWNTGAGYFYSSTPGHLHEFTFPATPVAAGQMIMAVKLTASAMTTGDGSLQLAVRRGTALERLYTLPRGSSFTLDGDYRDYFITLSNLPFPALMSRSDAWSADGSDFNDYSFGIYVDSWGSGELRVEALTLDVVYRPEVTLDELLAGELLDFWQWAEAEGIRWVPSSRDLPEGCGDYYYGVDRRPCAGLMLANEMFRGGRISHARGQEEIETARVVLLNVTEVAHERDADGGEAALDLYPQGFWTWLLAYGDRASVANSRMTDSTGSGYNSEKGLDPKDWSSVYGRRFTVAATADFPASGDVDDSFIYSGRETVWYGTKDATSFGDHADTSQLQRGEFGSLNQLHRYNVASEVYPEVTDHPTCWSGRWVKIWFCPIDRETGYPFPRSLAMARSYLWGDHEQEIGPGKNQYVIKLAPFLDILKAKVPAVPQARVKGINWIGSQIHMVIGFGSAANPPVWTDYPISNLNNHYASRQKLIDDLNNEIGTIFTAGSSPSVSKASPLISVAYDRWHRIALSHDLSAILGFKSAGKGKSTWLYPDGQTVGAAPAAGTLQEFKGSEKPAESFVSSSADRLYVQDDDLADWPSTLGAIASTKDRLCLVAGVDEDVPMVSEFAATATGSDALGDYIDIVAKQPGSLDMFIRERPRIKNQAGDRPLKAAVMLVSDTVEVHNFFLRLMISTGFGHNGSYDLWPLGIGAGIDERLLGTATWVLTGSALDPGSQYRTYFLLDPATVSDLLDEELKFVTPLYLRQDEEGRLVLERHAPPSTSDVLPALLEEHLRRGQPIRQRHGGRVNVTNHVTVDVDHNPFTDKHATKLEARETNSIRVYGDKAQSSKHRGLRTIHTPGTAPVSTSPYSAFYSAARDLFERFAWEAPIISLSCGPRLLALSAGDKVALTLPHVQDVRDRSTAGVTARGVELLKLDKNLVTGECSAQMTYDQLPRKHGGYAPAAEVVSWDGGTNTVTVQANTYTSADDSETDAGFFGAGDKAVVVEWNSATPAVWHATIASVSGNTITFTGGPGAGRTPTAEDRIIWEDWSTETTAQQDEGYVHVSDGGYVDAGDTVDGWHYSS